MTNNKCMIVSSGTGMLALAKQRSRQFMMTTIKRSTDNVSNRFNNQLISLKEAVLSLECAHNWSPKECINWDSYIYLLGK
jgi:hypothetical protein